ncbi:XRE family transcriptional regulator [Actinophytocola sp.]|uniref:helix-turn-helix domain-containing protein n=1 Tax=Actinophytocola sp. TaxID=1872138 RepID=UPI002D7E9B2E|nr:XRE family transcriptional regulator [Actinophytocola sp.]HET9138311.1 XRE family transcriptional regulator [Actinophytocola sp.]
MSDPFSTSLAEAVQAARLTRDLSVSALADRSGVSRAMIGKVERGEAQPTAALLGRLCGALGMTLSELVARAEGDGGRLVRAERQPTWTDPETGYRRRAVSAAGGPSELVEVELPGRARASFPADTYTFAHHHIWVLAGHLRFHEGETVHDLHPGDCLRLGPPAPCTYENPGRNACRYLVVLTRRPA